MAIENPSTDRPKLQEVLPPYRYLIQLSTNIMESEVRYRPPHKRTYHEADWRDETDRRYKLHAQSKPLKIPGMFETAFNLRTYDRTSPRASNWYSYSSISPVIMKHDYEGRVISTSDTDDYVSTLLEYLSTASVAPGSQLEMDFLDLVASLTLESDEFKDAVRAIGQKGLAVLQQGSARQLVIDTKSREPLLSEAEIYAAIEQHWPLA